MPTLSSTLGSARRLATSRSGVLGLTTAGTLVVRIGSSMALTRLLAPDNFGLVGIISSVFFVIAMLTDLGFQSHIVRHEQGEDPRFLDVLWTIHAWRGAVLTVIGIALAPVAAWLFAKPELTLPLAVASFTMFFGGLASFGPIVALRNDGSRFISLFELGLNFLGAVIGVLFALWLRNIWALIASMLVQAAVRSALSWYVFPKTRRRLARDPKIAREFFAFSRLVMASSTLTLLQTQTDKFIFARLFTLSEFGLYGLAVNLATAPAGFADAYVHRVIYPIYAKTWRENPDAISDAYYACRRTVLLLYSFAVGGMIGTAPLIVALLYDPRYQMAGTFLSLLAIGSAFRLPNLAAAELMTAIGRIKATVQVNLVRLMWIVAGAWPAYHVYGGVGLVAVAATVELPAFLFLGWRLQGAGVLRLRQELLFLVTLAAGASIGFALTWVVRMLIHVG